MFHNYSDFFNKLKCDELEDDLWNFLIWFSVVNGREFFCPELKMTACEQQICDTWIKIMKSLLICMDIMKEDID